MEPVTAVGLVLLLVGLWGWYRYARMVFGDAGRGITLHHGPAHWTDQYITYHRSTGQWVGWDMSGCIEVCRSNDRDVVVGALIERYWKRAEGIR